MYDLILQYLNGLKISFVSGDRMGLPRPPAFLDPSLDAETILNNGVSYASGGGGILNETSSLFVSFNVVFFLSHTSFD